MFTAIQRDFPIDGVYSLAFPCCDLKTGWAAASVGGSQKTMIMEGYDSQMLEGYTYLEHRTLRVGGWLEGHILVQKQNLKNMEGCGYKTIENLFWESLPQKTVAIAHILGFCYFSYSPMGSPHFFGPDGRELYVFVPPERVGCLSFDIGPKDEILARYAASIPDQEDL